MDVNREDHADGEGPAVERPVDSGEREHGEEGAELGQSEQQQLAFGEQQQDGGSDAGSAFLPPRSLRKAIDMGADGPVLNGILRKQIGRLFPKLASVRGICLLRLRDEGFQLAGMGQRMARRATQYRWVDRNSTIWACYFSHGYGPDTSMSCLAVRTQDLCNPMNKMNSERRPPTGELANSRKGETSARIANSVTRLDTETTGFAS